MQEMTSLLTTFAANLGGLNDEIARMRDFFKAGNVALERHVGRIPLPMIEDVAALPNGHAEEAAPAKGRRR